MGLRKRTTSDIIARAESYDQITAGVATLKAVLEGPSHRVEPENLRSEIWKTDGPTDERCAANQSILVLGLYHPENTPQLDYWDSADTPGNRRLREISTALKHWLLKTYDIIARPLPYHVEKGGLFLKDAAVLAGLGIIGKNNLLVHPQWGPRIRLRALIIEADLQPTRALKDFDPCHTCKVFCQKACPVKAFRRGKYRRSICLQQMNDDKENKNPQVQNQKLRIVIQYCRACEFACPVGGS